MLTHYQVLRAIIITTTFGLWSVAINLLGLLYLINVYINRDLFEVRIHLQRLTMIEVPIVLFVLTVVSLREIYASWGWELQYYIMDLAFVLMMMAILCFYPARFVHILMVYDESLRRFYYQHFTFMKELLVLWCFIFFVAIYLPLYMGYKGCFTR